ncbi:MAG: hypothetical protein GY749_35730 [Desulfobacteraceae bacterium]|nr:hypothetical protein [Desulfobacteraceae bacterium]
MPVGSVVCALQNPQELGSIRYLSPYVFKVAVSDSRIVSAEDGKVTFTYYK